MPFISVKVLDSISCVKSLLVFCCSTQRVSPNLPTCYFKYINSCQKPHTNFLKSCSNTTKFNSALGERGGALLNGMESSEHCNLSDHLLKAPPPDLALPPPEPRALPLTLTVAPLFHFPPNNSVTNWACQKTIYHCPTSHPPLPSTPSSPLLSSLSVSFSSRPHYRTVPLFLTVFFHILMVLCFPQHEHFIFLPLHPPSPISFMPPLLLLCILVSLSISLPLPLCKPFFLCVMSFICSLISCWATLRFFYDRNS